MAFSPVRTPLTAEEVVEHLAQHPGWEGDTEEIHKVYKVEYHAGIEVVNEVAQAAIELEHHPDIDIRWESLKFSITTHTSGDKVTPLDFLLVERIERSAVQHGATTA